MASVPTSAEVIERILAVVDGRPILLSEVALVERVRQLDRASALEALIDERLMFREASRLPQAAATAEDEERAYRSLLEKDPALPGAAEVDLRRLARRQTAILRYIDLRFRSQVRVGDEAVRQAYEEDVAGRPGAPPFDTAAAALRERLLAKELDEKIEDWIADLRSSAEIRYNP